MGTYTPPPLSDVQPTTLPLSSSADELRSRTMPPPLLAPRDPDFHWLPVITPPRTSFFVTSSVPFHVHRPLFSSTVK